MASIIVWSFCILTGCSDRSNKPSIPSVFTADIQAGILKHIEEETRLGNGYFNLTIQGENHSLKLVKIHTEYLATLGPQSYFACVDLADTKGDVYDVDFFLAGKPGSMKVTRTIPHKVNGQPYYFWLQNDDDTWGMVPVSHASRELMGIIVPNDEFDFIYKMTLPEFSGNARLWIPSPATDQFQEVEIVELKAPSPHQLLEETRHGNKVFFWELTHIDSGKSVEIRYHVKRIEKSAYIDNSTQPADYLSPNRLVPNNENFAAIANEITADKKGDLVKARALYDHVIDKLRYARAGDGWGRGDAVFACNAHHGNCTDFHAYFISLARAVGIPARFAIGAGIPSNRDEGGVDGYHCWVEFYAEDKWWPVDISEADKYSALSSYYFGHHPANRFEFSQGRDLEVDPMPASGPINFLAYPVLEIDGHQTKSTISFTFTRPDKNTK